MYLDHFDYPLVLFQGSKKKVEKKSEKDTKAKLKDVSVRILTFYQSVRRRMTALS